MVCRYILTGSAMLLQVLKPFIFVLCLSARVIAFLMSSALDKVRESLVPGKMEVPFLWHLVVGPSSPLLRASLIKGPFPSSPRGTSHPDSGALSLGLSLN